ncbi:Uncharacterised protein [Acholeplasma oculi]|uniref:DUF3139 domain-containing protein n=1 Tax=Acholeplasma oculi TaxID=35623 RepID=A0A061ACD4_9MOLU|nr:hypothetical protein [Acholeplasma oculi]CDR31498.1 hypothetical protein Aocu_14250 [Acholeplasma oculi]SKC49385.1 hypothetical protein SAMN02745122_1402 [Acholeplasma oculi]SUT92260.1 Uncharacterised protein [Acholeplasma oculi]
MEEVKPTTGIKRRTKYIIGITILVIILLIAVVSILIRDHLATLNSDEDFVKHHLMYLDEGASDISFIEATLYINENETYLEIVYDYHYQDIDQTTRYLVNKQSGQFVNGGYEDNYPEFMNKFNDIKSNYEHKIVYSTEDIHRLLGK